MRAESVESLRREFDRSGLGQEILSSVPPGLRGGGGQFGDGLRFAGWTSSPAEPNGGDTVQIDFYWEVTEGPQTSWKVFVHLEPQQGRGSRLNGDHEPVAGRYPTRVWQAGEVVRDRWSLRLPGHTSSSSLDLWTGFYVGDTRMELTKRRGVRTDGANRLMVGTLQVR